MVMIFLESTCLHHFLFPSYPSWSSSFLWGTYPHTCEQCFASLLTMCSQSIIPRLPLATDLSRGLEIWFLWIMETFSVQCHYSQCSLFLLGLCFMSPMLSQPMVLVCCTVLKLYIFKLHRPMSCRMLLLFLGNMIFLFSFNVTVVVFIFLTDVFFFPLKIRTYSWI